MTNTSKNKKAGMTVKVMTADEIAAKQAAITPVKTAMTAEEKQAAKAAAAQKHYEEQLNALLALNIPQAQAEQILIALKPIARQASESIPDDRWNLARGLSGWMLTPDSKNNTENNSPFIVSDVPDILSFDQLEKDIKYFLVNSTFANSCKKGKKTILCGVQYDKQQAAEMAAVEIIQALRTLVNKLASKDNN